MADQPIIIKRIKKGHASHHGGAWKVAYADFVTAMMAFFLLFMVVERGHRGTVAGRRRLFRPNHRVQFEKRCRWHAWR